MSKSRRITAAAGAVALLAGAGAAIAADGASTITVSAPTQLTAGQKAPFDAPASGPSGRASRFRPATCSSARRSRCSAAPSSPAPP